MSDYDRVRHSQEPPLAFDGRRAARASGPAPVTLILSLMLLIAVGGGVFYIYRGGVRGSGDAPRPVGAPVGDVRSAAPPLGPDARSGRRPVDLQGRPQRRAGRASLRAPARTANPAAGYGDGGRHARASGPCHGASRHSGAGQVRRAGASQTGQSGRDARCNAGRRQRIPAPAKTASIDTVLASAAPAAAKSGPVMVQIGAFSSKDLADAGWNGAAGLAPGDMAGKGKRIVPLAKAERIHPLSHLDHRLRVARRGCGPLRQAEGGGAGLSRQVTAACIFGCAGPRLGGEEAAFFRDVDPWGFILFRRNIDTPDQVRALTSALRATVDRPDAPILIDQEGGRVQRLGPPHWRRYPPARAVAALPRAGPGGALRRWL